MKKRYTLRSGVFLILTKIKDDKEYILLQKRYHTGVMDGQYDVAASGHLEKGETLAEAMIRETKEEIGIDISKNDLKYVCTMHASFKDAEYLLATFTVSNYQGTPSIMEPDKCSELKWVPIDELPTEIVETRKIMIDNYKNNNLYSEYGF